MCRAGLWHPRGFDSGTSWGRASHRLHQSWNPACRSLLAKAQAASVFCSQSRDEMMPPRCSLSYRAAPFTLLLLQAALPPSPLHWRGWSTLRAAPGLDVLSNVPGFMSSERPLESSEPHKWKLFTTTLISLMWKVFKVKSCSNYWDCPKLFATSFKQTKLKHTLSCCSQHSPAELFTEFWSSTSTLNFKLKREFPEKVQ